MSASRPASMSAWSQLSPSTGYGEPVIRTVVAAGLGSSLVLFGGLHTLSPHIIAQAGLPPSSTPKRQSRPLSVPLYPVPSPFSATPPSANPRYTLSTDIMGNCHSKSDDDRHGGRDGYSSSTEKLNPRPYNPNNPNSTINYTKNKIVINVPPGQAIGSQRPGQATVSQRQQQPQFSSPPKGKRRRPNPDLRPEYYLHISCSTCDRPDKRGGRRCATAWDMNLQNPTANRDPLYRGHTPRETWHLEVDFCDTLTSLLATQATGAKAAGKERGKKTPQEVLGRYVRDADSDPKVIPVDELLDALRKGEVKFTSSL